MPEIRENAVPVTVMPDIQKQAVRTLCDFYYSIQKTRIQTGNRLVASVRPDLTDKVKKDLAEAVDAAEEELGNKDLDAREKQKAKVIQLVMKDYSLVHEQYIAKAMTQANLEKSIERLGEELAYIKSGVDYTLCDIYARQKEMEEDILKRVAAEVKKHPMWDAFFAHIDGCGPLVAAVCISYIDVHKCRHASALWRYTGLDVVYNPTTNRFEGHTKKHRTKVTYVDKNQQEAERDSIGYNPKLKTKVTEVFVSSVMKAYGGKVARAKANGDPIPEPEGYMKTYLNYKNRTMNKPEYKDASKMHIHRMAVRYTAKMFLQDLWNCWRMLEGYDPDPSYAVAKLGMLPHGTDQDISNND